MRRLGWLGASAAMAALLLGCSDGEDIASDDQDLIESQTIRILSVSDWHGQLDPLATPAGNVAGAAVLSSYFKKERAEQPNTLTLSAGDSFGATPPLASFFGDEPAALALNAMGLDANGLGNHDFDAGPERLAQLIDIADFPFVSANLKNVNEAVKCKVPADEACVQPYVIVKVGGVRVAIIGATNPDAANLLPPGKLGAIKVTAPAYAANNARKAAKLEGAKLFVALAHMGATAVDTEGNPTGPLIDFAHKLSGFDVVLGDHTNVQVNQVINGALVVENKSFGATYARIQLSVNVKTGKTKNPLVEFVTPLVDQVTPDAAIEQMLAPYRTELAKAFDGTIASTDGVFFRGNNLERLGEMPIGNLVADSLRLKYATQLGFTNGGGIRASIPSSYAPLDKTLRRPAEGYAAGPPYDLVVGDAYAVLPFGNSAVTRTITGQQLWAMMEHSVEALPAANGWFGQVSGFKVTFDSSKPVGQRVVSIVLDDGGAVAKDGATLTMATSDFIDAGGDGYGMLAGGDGVSRDKMADVLLEHIKGVATLHPETQGRLVDLNAPAPQ